MRCDTPERCFFRLSLFFGRLSKWFGLSLLPLTMLVLTCTANRLKRKQEILCWFSEKGVAA